MAHKVILPPKKNYIPQFLKQRDINSYYLPPCISSADLYHVTCWGDEGGEAGIKVLSDQLMDSPHWEQEIRFKAKQLTKSITLRHNTNIVIKVCVNPFQYLRRFCGIKISTRWENTRFDNECIIRIRLMKILLNRKCLSLYRRVYIMAGKTSLNLISEYLSIKNSCNVFGEYADKLLANSSKKRIEWKLIKNYIFLT